jgi:hypothetical protein
MTPPATATLEVRPRSAIPATRDPERWIVPIALFATTSIVIGAIWDISWHMTIGRDSLWTAPHLLEQLGASLAGITGGAYTLWLTFRAPESALASTVRFWGFRSPVGVLVIIWGALAMIASVPFDNWWHNAYGLDVEILSPPHTVLMAGVIGIQLGTLLFALAVKNRSEQSGAVADTRAYTYATGVLLLMGTVALYEEIGYANTWHRSAFYCITAVLLPFILVGAARSTRSRWAATSAAATYMAIMLVMMWTLQLFPAQPKLAPIYNPVTRMVPMAFPMVLVAPALVIDVLERRFRDATSWLIAFIFGAAFVAAMLVVHWPFGEFMLSPAARNFIFAADQWPYMLELGDWTHRFWGLDVSSDGAWSAARFGVGLGIAVIIATVSARVGMAWGHFTRRLLR